MIGAIVGYHLRRRYHLEQQVHYQRFLVNVYLRISAWAFVVFVGSRRETIYPGG